MYETEDGKTTSKSSRLIKDGGESSSNENIRYQAMDMIKKDTRVHRKNSTNNSRSNSTATTAPRKYYNSWDQLVERSEVAQGKMVNSSLLSGQQFGSTGSLASASDTDQPHTVVNQLYQQTPGHHLQLHAVHNTSYQSTNSTLETCLESDENDLDDL